MMNFKDQIKKDLSIFINPVEFADIHRIDDKEMEVVIDSDTFSEFTSTEERENAMQGIFQSVLTIYVKSSDYKKPKVGYRLKLDDDHYDVSSVSESEGLLRINLVANES